MTKKQGAQQATSSKEESSDSKFWAPTGWGALTGAGASTAIEILDDALVTMKATKYGKWYEGTKLAIESAAGLVLNEGLEVSKDKEKGFWGDGYLDFAEDVALTVGGNYLGSLAAAAVLAPSASVLATAAVGVLTASAIGGAWSWGKSLIVDYLSENETTEASISLGNGLTIAEPQGSSNQTNQNSQYTYYLGATDNSGAFDNSLSFDGPFSNGKQNNNEQQGREDEELSDEEKAKRIADYLTKLREEEDAMDDEIFGDDYEVEDEQHETEGGSRSNDESNENSNTDDGSSLWDDFVNWLFGDDDNESEASDDPLTIRAKAMDNPMNENGDTSYYDGKHDELRGFRGDIDYGPNGKQDQGYDGEYDDLIGFNPRIDYGPNGKPLQGYNGEYNRLKGFNPRIDWDQDHVDTDEFTGNTLTDRLGEINPRAIQNRIKAASFANNIQQVEKSDHANPESSIDTQLVELSINTKGYNRELGSSNSAIAKFEVDQDFTLVSVELL